MGSETAGKLAGMAKAPKTDAELAEAKAAAEERLYDQLLSSRLGPWTEIQRHVRELDTFDATTPDGEVANMASPERAAVLGFALGVRGLVELCLRRPKGDPIRAEILAALVSALADGRVKLVCPSCGTSNAP